MKNLTFEKYIAFLALFISILSMTASIKSCSISHEALNISREDQDSRRKLVLKAEFSENEFDNGMILTSINPEISLQNTCIYIPGQKYFLNNILNEALPGTPLYISMDNVKNARLEFHLNKINKQGGFIGNTHLEAYIATSYIIEGDIFIDISNYEILYQIYGGMDNGSKSVSLSFFNIILKQRIDLINIAKNVDQDYLCTLLG